MEERLVTSSLLVVDEILNSTNPIEAMLLSYQYARIIGNRLSSTCRLMMTTHYPVLTTLAKHHPTQFVNWAMGPQYAVQVGQACHASPARPTLPSASCKTPNAASDSTSIAVSRRERQRTAQSRQSSCVVAIAA